MDEKKLREQIHYAMDTHSPSCAADPYRVQRVLNMAHQPAQTEGRGVRRKLSVGFVLMVAAVLVTFTALAYTVITVLLSPRVDAYTVADRALEEKYGLTPSMLGFFERYSRGNDEDHFIVEYEPRFEEPLASRLGVYSVTVADGRSERVTWSLDGISTEGGFDADGWGAEQLGEMVRITGVTHDTSRFQRKASGEEIDLYADMEPVPDGTTDDEFPEFDQLIEDQIKVYQRDVTEAGKEIEPQSRFTREELIDLGRQGIIAAYRLDQEQQRRLVFADHGYYIAYYSTIGVDQRPTFNMTFQSQTDGGWQDGDGIYTIAVNVLNGTVEYLEYDTMLDGNG